MPHQATRELKIDAAPTYHRIILLCIVVLIADYRTKCWAKKRQLKKKNVSMVLSLLETLLAHMCWSLACICFDGEVGVALHKNTVIKTFNVSLCECLRTTKLTCARCNCQPKQACKKTGHASAAVTAH